MLYFCARHIVSGNDIQGLVERGAQSFTHYRIRWFSGKLCAMGTSSSWWANHQAAGTPPLSDTLTPLLAIQRGGMTRWARTNYRWEDGFKTQPEVSVDVEFKVLQTSE